MDKLIEITKTDRNFASKFRTGRMMGQLYLGVGHEHDAADLLQNLLNFIDHDIRSGSFVTSCSTKEEAWYLLAGLARVYHAAQAVLTDRLQSTSDRREKEFYEFLLNHPDDLFTLKTPWIDKK